jgi:hypothetical protein
LRSALESFKARQPVKAYVKALVSSNQVEDNKPVTATGAMEVLVEHDEAGLSVKWSQADLLRVGAEADKKNANPDSLAIIGQTMNSFEAPLMRSLLDQSPAMLRDLKTASLQSDAKDTLNGAALRKLVFKLSPALSESQKKSTKSISVTLTMWVNDSNTPVYSEEKTEFKGSRFFITFDSAEVHKKSYKVVGDRLVVTQLETTTSWNMPIAGSSLNTNKFTVTVL